MQDWQRLIVNYSLPHVSLPHINAGEADIVGEGLEPPATELTPEIIRIINSVDDFIFREFHYAKLPET